jgi:hypothetical protein
MRSPGESLSRLLNRYRPVRLVVSIIFLVCAIIVSTPDTVGVRIWRHCGRGLAELPGGPLLVP